MTKISNPNKPNTIPIHNQSNSSLTMLSLAVHPSLSYLPPPAHTPSTITSTTTDNNTTKFDNATVTELSYNTTKINQTQYSTDKNAKNVFTFAAITANENPPSRDPPLVLNSIDGIPQKEYTLWP